MVNELTSQKKGASQGRAERSQGSMPAFTATRHCWSRASAALLGIAMGLAIGHSTALAASFTPLPLLPGSTSSRAFGVSGDGSVVVGYDLTNLGQNQAWRWTQAGGTVALPLLPGGSSSEAYDVSGDGSIVGARIRHSAGRRRGAR